MCPAEAQLTGFQSAIMSRLNFVLSAIFHFLLFLKKCLFWGFFFFRLHCHINLPETKIAHNCFLTLESSVSQKLVDCNTKVGDRTVLAGRQIYGHPSPLFYLAENTM